MTLGERLKDYRAREGLSQEQLAERLNVSRQAITKWEADRGIPDIDNLIAISGLLHLSLDELVRGSEGARQTAAEAHPRRAIGHLISAAAFVIAAVVWVSCGLNWLSPYRQKTTALLELCIAAFCAGLAVSQIVVYKRKRDGTFVSRKNLAAAIRNWIDRMNDET